MGIYFGQVSEDLLILTLVIITNTVTFIDDKQREFSLKGVKITRYRLYAAKYHFPVALFTLQSCGKNIGFQPQRAIFGMVLRDQFFNVRQYQHATTRHAGQFSNHQAFSRTGWQDDNRWRAMVAEMVERGIHGFFLVRAKSKNHGLIKVSSNNV